jgi:hypothetical protein
VSGGACGGLLLWALGADRRAYLAVFLVSCLLRLVALPLLLAAGITGRPHRGGGDRGAGGDR